MFNNVSTLFKVASLTQTVRELIERDGVVNNEDSHDLCKAVLSENETDFEPNSPKWLL